MQFAVLQKEMVAALKAHDKPRKDTISLLVSAAKKLAIDEGVRDDIPDDLVDRAITKELREAREQYDSCPESRPELKAQYKARVDVISEFAPKMMSEEEVEKFLKDNYADLLATKNKGQIMKTVMPVLKGKADGKMINTLVGKLCR